jgi:FkbM family methyltransferase
VSRRGAVSLRPCFSAPPHDATIRTRKFRFLKDQVFLTAIHRDRLKRHPLKSGVRRLASDGPRASDALVAYFMKNPVRTIKAFLWRHGLYSYASRKYRHILRFAFERPGLTVQFHTEDEYSNAWFFPRFAGGDKGHEHKVTDLILAALAGPKQFIDVGANLGWFTCIAAKYMPGGKVYSFEMDGSNFGLLQKNIALNGCLNAEAHHQAVAEASGTRYYDRPTARPSPVYQLDAVKSEAGSKSLVAVDTISLDDFCGARGVRPDVIKIDVEGAEMSVLRGMKRVLEEDKPILFMELHPYHLPKFGTSTRELLGYLIERGYTVMEIENMRDYDSRMQLTGLTADSVLRKNTMLYASVRPL